MIDDWSETVLRSGVASGRAPDPVACTVVGVRSPTSLDQSQAGFGESHRGYQRADGGLVRGKSSARRDAERFHRESAAEGWGEAGRFAARGVGLVSRIC